MSLVLWIVGEPGVGKTTLGRLLMEARGPILSLVGRPKWTLGEDYAAAGHYTGQAFDGADTVPIGDIKAALSYWETNLQNKLFTLFDGDKFSNSKALQLVAVSGAQCVCVHLVAAAGLTEGRREARGTKQNSSWVAGRRTKAANFSGLFRDRLDLEASCPPLELLGSVDRFLAQLRASTVDARFKEDLHG